MSYSMVDNIVKSNQLTGETATTGEQVMGKDDFLKLLLVQMEHQDPLDPIDNREMLTQMAQFTSLEQMSNLNDNFSRANEIAQLMDAVQLIGKDVDVLDPSAPEDEPASLTSKVESVNFTSAGPLLTLENGVVTTVPEVVKVTVPIVEE